MMPYALTPPCPHCGATLRARRGALAHHARQCPRNPARAARRRAEAPAGAVEVLCAPLRAAPPWRRYADALRVLIAREPSDLERYLLRVRLLKALHTPYKRTR